MPKPRVLTKCVANAYTAPCERIVEFTSGVHHDASGARIGGLISLRDLPDGSLVVRVYRLDKRVAVHVATEKE